MSEGSWRARPVVAAAAALVALLVLLSPPPAAAAGCESDQDCKGGRVCQQGSCAEPIRCTGDSDCGAEQVCSKQRCVAPAACDKDTDCPGSELCVAGRCRPPEQPKEEPKKHGREKGADTAEPEEPEVGPVRYGLPEMPRSRPDEGAGMTEAGAALVTLGSVFAIVGGAVVGGTDGGTGRVLGGLTIANGSALAVSGVVLLVVAAATSKDPAPPASPVAHAGRTAAMPPAGIVADVSLPIVTW